MKALPPKTSPNGECQACCRNFASHVLSTSELPQDSELGRKATLNLTPIALNPKPSTRSSPEKLLLEAADSCGQVPASGSHRVKYSKKVTTTSKIVLKATVLFISSVSSRIVDDTRYC